MAERETFAAAAAHVAAADPAMARVVGHVGPIALRARSRDHFGSLARAIVYQQLAGRAAAAIHARFAALFDGRPTPEAVLVLPEDRLRSAGLSGAKAASIRDLAAKVADGTVPLRGISRLGDEEIVERLTQVRGIGRWTAEMFLIFQLHRMDVWPVDDYGVRKGYALMHRLAELPTPKGLAHLGDVYRPHRTAAAWYCWRTVDTVLPEAGG